MKVLIYFILLMLPLSVWSQNEFVIHGQIDSAVSGKVFLVYTYKKRICDSATLLNGQFTFRGVLPETSHAVLYREVAHKTPDHVYFYIRNESIEVISPDSLNNAQVSSPINKAYREYLNTFETETKNIQALKGPGIHEVEKITDSVKRQLFMDDYEERMAKIDSQEARIRDNVKQYLLEHPDSYFSLNALQTIMGHLIDTDVPEAEQLYRSLSGRIQNTAEGLKIGEKLSQLRTVTIGAKAPLFEQNDVDGRTVRLSDFRGKYVLIDFWASWCVYCRLENPNLRKAYEQYKGKNFTVLGVSLDDTTKREEWVAAIKKDGLPWTQVSDLRGADNAIARLYGIKSIPQNVLVDPDGVIVAVNLRKEELLRELDRLLDQ